MILLDAIFLTINKTPIYEGKNKLNYNLEFNNDDLEKYKKRFVKAFDNTCAWLKRSRFNMKTLPSHLIIKWLIYFFYNMNSECCVVANVLLSH